jgi:uncharacterized protein (TIGR02145 family)
MTSFVLILFVYCGSVLASPIKAIRAGKVNSNSQPVQVNHGWNLLSLPLSVADGTKDSLFPDASSPAYIFHNGYQPKDTLANGYGYWLKFDSSGTVPISGITIWRDTIPVQTGWNMIGALSMPLVAGTIGSAPFGIIGSSFYGFTPGLGYQPTDTLQPGKGYWIKANQDGNIILDADSAGAYAKPCRGTPTVSYAGKIYNTVQIGNVCWLKENLNVGTMVDSALDQTDNGAIEKHCYLGDAANCNTYGGIYQWKEAMQYSTTAEAQGICPGGWHMPTLPEFQMLATTVGNNGNALKAAGQGTGDGAGTDSSGFSALFAGYLNILRHFEYQGVYTSFWSATEASGIGFAYSLSLYHRNSTVFLNDHNENYGYSVRCVKNN